MNNKAIKIIVLILIISIFSQVIFNIVVRAFNFNELLTYIILIPIALIIYNKLRVKIK